MNPLLGLIIGMVISLVIIPIMWRLAPQLRMLDKPDPRKVHCQAIPRVGGWGIVLGALLPVLILLDPDPLVLSYLIGSIILFLFGAWDDARELGPYPKFLGQVSAVIIIVFYGDLWIERIPWLEISLSPALGIPLTVFAMVGMINATNTSDGLDGLAGGESLLSLIVIAFLAYIAEGIIAMTIAAAAIGGILGFLRYNTHPAQVFMGDAGSQFLGFTLGFLAILLIQKVNPVLSPAVVLLILGLPVIDIIAAIACRTCEGKKWFYPDRNYLHHRLLARGFDHYETVVIIYSIQATFVISAIFLRYEYDTLILALYLGACILIVVPLVFAERRGWRPHGGDPQSHLGGWIVAIKEHPALRALALKFITLTVPVYIIGTSLWAQDAQEFGSLSAVLGMAMTAGLLLNNREPRLEWLVAGFKEHPVLHALSLKSVTLIIPYIRRGIVYVMAILAIYLPIQPPMLDTLVLIYFMVLAVAVGFIIRSVEDEMFKTTPMDYLLLFSLLTIVILGGRYLEIQAMELFMVKSVILLYGCEILLERRERYGNSLNISTATALGILGSRGLIL